LHAGAPPSKLSAIAIGVSLPWLCGSQIGRLTGLPSTQTRQTFACRTVSSTARCGRGRRERQRGRQKDERACPTHGSGHASALE
jgi:hypothetical protein